MKVFITENWEEISGELSKLGKAIPVEKGDIEEKEKIVVGKNKTSITAEVDLKDILELLANAGYDFVALKGFEKEEVNIAGIPVASTVEEVLQAEDFETLNSLLRKVKAAKDSEKCGAIGVFIGFVRKISDGKEVLRLEYEKYEDVYAEKLKEIEDRLKSYPGVVDVKIYHKSGVILPGEDIIYVVIMGGHRKDIWRPLEESMEIIKKELPIWKKEVYVDGEMWVHDKS
jgi:molybdopterin synthase catalytic subunit